MQLKKTLINFDVILASVALAFLTIVIFVQVILRFFFKSPLMGAEEFARYMLMWMIITPLTFTERNHGHIIMEELQNLLPGIIRKIIRFLCGLCTTVIYVFLTISTVRVIQNNMGNTTAELKIPFLLFFLPTLIGFASMAILRIITHICHLMKKDLPWASL
jgi:TRAP-type C4-dicarboxylate transport system permease small subunit